MFLLDNFDLVLSKTESDKDAVVLVVEQEDLPAVGRPVKILGLSLLAKKYFDIHFSNETICRLHVPSNIFDDMEDETLWVCVMDNGRVVFEQEVPFEKKN